MDDGRDLLVRGIAAAKAKSWDEARFFLEKFLGINPPVEMRVEAWRCLAEMSSNASEKRVYIGRILAFDPTDGLARRSLAVLDGRLNPADIVNPDRIPTAASEVSTPVITEGLRCPQCGSGRLVASRDGVQLVCEHCKYQEPISQRGLASVIDHDFAATIWTAKGHRPAEQALAFACGGCGASFLVLNGVHSGTCPFCGSVHVDSEATLRELLAPDAILPFGPSVNELRETLRSAMKREPPSDPLAVYLPVWTFSFAGSVHWTGYRQEKQGFESRRVPESGDYAVIDQRALVCATPSLPETFGDLIDGFDLSSLVPYDSRQLAGCLAATYEITLDEASIRAREKAVKALRDAIGKEHSEIFGLDMTFERVGVDTFQLLLLPFWSLQAGGPDAPRLFFVNGQTGKIDSTARKPGLLSWIARLAGFPTLDS